MALTSVGDAPDIGSGRNGPKKRQLASAVSVTGLASTKLDWYSASFEKTSIGGSAIIIRKEDRCKMFVDGLDFTLVGEVFPA
jgi:hypothetical protein